MGGRGSPNGPSPLGIVQDQVPEMKTALDESDCAGLSWNPAALDGKRDREKRNLDIVLLFTCQ